MSSHLKIEKQPSTLVNPAPSTSPPKEKTSKLGELIQNFKQNEKRVSTRQRSVSFSPPSPETEKLFKQVQTQECISVDLVGPQEIKKTEDSQDRPPPLLSIKSKSLTNTGDLFNLPRMDKKGWIKLEPEDEVLRKKLYEMLIDKEKRKEIAEFIGQSIKKNPFQAGRILYFLPFYHAKLFIETPEQISWEPLEHFYQNVNMWKKSADFKGFDSQLQEIARDQDPTELVHAFLSTLKKKKNATTLRDPECTLCQFLAEKEMVSGEDDNRKIFWLRFFSLLQIQCLESDVRFHNPKEERYPFSKFFLTLMESFLEKESICRKLAMQFAQENFDGEFDKTLKQFASSLLGMECALHYAIQYYTSLFPKFSKAALTEEESNFLLSDAWNPCLHTIKMIECSLTPPLQRLFYKYLITSKDRIKLVPVLFSLTEGWEALAEEAFKNLTREEYLILLRHAVAFEMRNQPLKEAFRFVSFAGYLSNIAAKTALEDHFKTLKFLHVLEEAYKHVKNPQDLIMDITQVNIQLKDKDTAFGELDVCAEVLVAMKTEELQKELEQVAGEKIPKGVWKEFKFTGAQNAKELILFLEKQHKGSLRIYLEYALKKITYRDLSAAFQLKICDAKIARRALLFLDFICPVLNCLYSADLPSFLQELLKTIRNGVQFSISKRIQNLKEAQIFEDYCIGSFLFLKWINPYLTGIQIDKKNMQPAIQITTIILQRFSSEDPNNSSDKKTSWVNIYNLIIKGYLSDHNEYVRRNSSGSFVDNLENKKCIPCNQNTPPIKGAGIKERMASLNQWELIEEKKIVKQYKFKNFADAMAFANRLGELAEKEGHHPTITISWGEVKVSFWTHAIQGLSENDFIMAAKCDNLPK